MRDYIDSFGTSNLCYLNKAWIEGTPDYEKDNLKMKYVKLSKSCTVANCFTDGIRTEIKKCISHIDPKTKLSIGIKQ